MTGPAAGIRAIGRYVPARTVTNHELAERLPTSDAWIRANLGIVTRQVSAPAETASVLGVRALADACEQAGLRPSDIDLLICCTYTPDQMIPTTAGKIARAAGVPRLPAFDLNAGGCAASVYGLDVGRRFVESGDYRRVAVVLTDVGTKLLDPYDRTFNVILGDAAACYLLEPCRPGGGVRSVKLQSNHDGHEAIRSVRESRLGPAGDAVTSGFGDHFLTMRGPDVREFVLKTVPPFIEGFLASAGLTADDVEFFALHQANLYLVRGVMERLSVSADRTLTNVERFGNTGAASVPLVLREALDAGRLRPGSNTLLTAFGAGLNYAAALLRWCGPDDFTSSG